MIKEFSKMGLLSASLLAVLGSVIGASVPLYQQYFAEHKVMIAPWGTPLTN